MLVRKMIKTQKITVAGFGGQGVMTIGQILAYTGNEYDLNTLWYPSYGPETRGGTANCAVTISKEAINSPVFSEATTLIILNEPSLKKFIDKIENNGNLIYNSSLIVGKVLKDSINIYPIPANDIALELGNARVSNMVVLGAYLALNPSFEEKMLKVIEVMLGENKKDLLQLNITALYTGKEYLEKIKHQ